MSRIVRKLKNGELKFNKEGKYWLEFEKPVEDMTPLATDEDVQNEISKIKEDINKEMVIDLSEELNEEVLFRGQLFGTRYWYSIKNQYRTIVTSKYFIRQANRKKSELKNTQLMLFREQVERKNNTKFMEKVFPTTVVYLADKYTEKINYIKSVIEPYQRKIEIAEQEIAEISKKYATREDRTKYITYEKFLKLEASSNQNI